MTLLISSWSRSASISNKMEVLGSSSRMKNLCQASLYLQGVIFALCLLAIPRQPIKTDVVPEAAHLKEVIRSKQANQECEQVFFVYISVPKYLILHCVQAGSWASLVDCKSVDL